jgi:hypothetical protein
MKKLFLIIFLLISLSLNAQIRKQTIQVLIVGDSVQVGGIWFTVLPDLRGGNVWLGINTFNKVIIDTVVMNYIDSAGSFKAGSIYLNGIDSSISGLSRLNVGSIYLNGTDSSISGVSRFNLSLVNPILNKIYDLGTSALFWRNIFTASLTLGIDSIGASTSDTIYAGRNTMLVNCDASNNDTVYLANIGITNGFECTVKKIDANATYVVVKAKGGLTIDGASDDKWNNQWQSRTFIYKNFQWYIK